MENSDTTLIEQEHVDRDSGNEKADLYNLINTCRQYNKHCTPEQVAKFMQRLKTSGNVTLFLADIGKYTKGLDYQGLITIMGACKFNKAKRECCEKLAEYLPEETSEDQKEEIASAITGAFERNKAKKALGLD